MCPRSGHRHHWNHHHWHRPGGAVVALTLLALTLSGCSRDATDTGEWTRARPSSLVRDARASEASAHRRASERLVAERLEAELSTLRPGGMAVTSVLVAGAEDLGTSGLTGRLRELGLLVLGATVHSAAEIGQVSYVTQVGEFDRLVPDEAVADTIADEAAPVRGYPGEVSSTEVSQLGDGVTRVFTRRGDATSVSETVAYVTARGTRLTVVRTSHTVSAELVSAPLAEHELGAVLVLVSTPATA